MIASALPPRGDALHELKYPGWKAARWLVMGLLASLVFCGISARAGDRVALVIGNGDYTEPLQKLDACPRDAEKMAAAFRAIGVQIYGGKPQLNLRADEMDAALNDFVRQLGKDSEAYIYFSGHGAQIGGSNYLLPVGFNARFENQAKRQAISLDAILEMLENTQSKLRVVILDSCRDVGEFLPGEPSLKGLTHRKGLSEQRVEAPETLVCFATKHGTAALADDTSSFYTRVLAEEMVKPGKIEDVLKLVARRVYAETESKQLPFTYGSLLQDHYFTSGTTPPAVPLPSPPPDLTSSKPPETDAPASMTPPPRHGGVSATKSAPFVNSLGQEFVPIPGTKVLFCRTDVRVRDFRQYAKVTGYSQVPGALLLKPGGFSPTWFLTAWKLDTEASWERPGYKQGEDYPVVCVNWHEAEAFCQWLSNKEGQTYRLPTDAEWSTAAGTDTYSWGNQFPPPKGAGNFADDSFIKSLPGQGWPVALLPGDGYARTSPVGHFSANRWGLYDMAGNVWQWVEDEYRVSMMDPGMLAVMPTLRNEKADDGTPLRVARGGSWAFGDAVFLRSATRAAVPAIGRSDQAGFRVVIELSGR